MADRSVGYGITGVSVDGADPLAVFDVTSQAVARARAGRGPTLIEARVTRLGQHTSQVGDLRSPRVVAAARHHHDPIPRFEHYLREHHLLSDAEAQTLADRAEAEVADAVAFARRAPEPPRERAFADVYSGSRGREVQESRNDS